ncbi:hypothetical protein ACHAPJ_011423 [Fusarium lateritium]
MMFFDKVLIIAVAAPNLARAGFAGAFSSGPTAPGNFIREANSTLVVPKAPSPQVGLLSLWVGMGTSNGDLIQALTESYEGNEDPQCGLLHGNWCSWTSTLNGTGQVGGRQVLTKAGDHVTMSYRLNDRTDQYDQFVLINGKVVSTFATSSGRAGGWGTAVECNDSPPATPCGIVPEHDWINTVLVLEKAQPSYKDTFGNGNSTGTLTSTDGGKTWVADKITIEESDFSTSA